MNPVVSECRQPNLPRTQRGYGPTQAESTKILSITFLINPRQHVPYGLFVGYKGTSGPGKPYMMPGRNEHLDATPANRPGPVDDKPFGK